MDGSLISELAARAQDTAEEAKQKADAAQTAADRAQASADSLEADLGVTSIKNFDAVATENDTNRCVGSISLPAGNYIVQFGGSFATNGTGYRRVIVDSHDDLSTVTLTRRNTVTQNGVSGTLTYMSGTTVVSLAADTTLYLHAKQNSGGNLNFSGFLNAMQITGTTAILSDISGGSDVNIYG